MAHMLRAVAKLKLAQSVMVGSVALVALGVAGGVSAPVLINMGTNVVTEVKDLQEEYPITYGGTLDLSAAKIHIGNAFDSTGQWISGDKFTVTGYDPNYVGTQDVTLTYLNFKKVIKVTTSPKKLLAPTPTFNSTTGVLNWEPIENATFYTVYLRNPETKAAITNYNTETTTYDFNSIAFFSQFETYVIAGSDKKGSNGVSAFTPSDESKSVLLRKISNVSDIHYDNSDGKFKWTGVTDASGYDVRINGSTFSPTAPEIAFDTTSPGDYNISIRSIGPNAGVDYATPVEATIRKMPTPRLSLVNGALTAADDENLVWYRDGIEFTGDVKTITGVGSYTITARNAARNATEIDSAMSAPLVLSKLGSPVLSLNDGKVLCSNVGTDNSVQYYLDGNAWGTPGSKVDLTKITEVGNHSITARTIGNTNQIDSEISNSVSVRKLPTPTISFADKRNFTFGNKDEGFAIFCGPKGKAMVELDTTTLDQETLSDGEKFPAGTYRVQTVNQGNKNELLASAPSAPYDFMIPDITATATTNGNYAQLSLFHNVPEVQTIYAKIHIEWVNSATSEVKREMDAGGDSSVVVRPQGTQGKPYEIPFNYQGVAGANMVRFKVTDLILNSSTDVFKKDYAPVSTVKIG